LVVFTVYEPPDAPGDLVGRAERLVFVKDGFLWMAALFPAIWLLVKGLWLELIVFLAAVAAVTWGLEAAGMPNATTGMLLLAVQIVFGFEAGSLYGAALERRGWRMAGTVAGRDLTECERRFLEAWLPAHGQAAAPAPGGPVSSWAATAWENAKDAIARGRRLMGAKA
jgi:hypothetical protein